LKKIKVSNEMLDINKFREQVQLYKNKTINKRFLIIMLRVLK